MSLKFYFSSFSEQGKRANNEDYIGVHEGNYYSFFIVCDGVGGYEKGEIASQMVVECFVSEISKNSTFVNPTYLNDLLVKTENKLSEYIDKNPDSKNMASTIALMYLKKDSALIGWVGDSRVYHIRDGKILYHTKDHSYVNYLISIGEITPEEAKNHPKKNVVMRVVQGEGTHARMDIHEINDIQPNDFFMLASDGVWDVIDEEDFARWFVKSTSVEKIEKQIKEKCKDLSNDNYSCVLVKMGQGSFWKRYCFW